MLLTADHLEFRKSPAGTRLFDLSRVEDLSITSAKAKRWLSLLSIRATPIVAPFVLAGLLVARVVQVLLFALLGLLVARGVSAPLDFSGPCGCRRSR